jgi:hypothetical protein
MRKEADTNKLVVDQPPVSLSSSSSSSSNATAAAFSFKKALLGEKSQRTYSEISRSEMSILRTEDSHAKRNALTLTNGNCQKKVTFSKELTKNEARPSPPQPLQQKPTSLNEFRERNLKSNSIVNLSSSASDFVQSQFQNITHKIDVEKLLKICQSSSFDYLSASSLSSASSRQHDEATSSTDHDSNRNNSFSSESLDEDHNNMLSKSTFSNAGGRSSSSPSNDGDNEDDSYENVNGNNEPAFPPFPLPPSLSELISRTDLNSSDSLNNSTSSNHSQGHGYMNSTSEEMVLIS